MGLYRLPSISILSNHMVRTERPMALLDHRGCPQSFVTTRVLSQTQEGIQMQQNLICTEEKIEIAKLHMGKPTRGGEGKTLFLGNLSVLIHPHRNSFFPCIQ